MDIEWQSVGRWAVTALPALVAVFGVLRGPGALRSKLRHDIEMLEKLPEGSAARTRLLEYIEKQVDRFARMETESSRDWMGFAVALICSVALLALTVWLVGLGEWWWRVTAGGVAVVALATLAVMFEYIQLVPRDEKGKKIKA